VNPPIRAGARAEQLRQDVGRDEAAQWETRAASLFSGDFRPLRELKIPKKVATKRLSRTSKRFVGPMNSFHKLPEQGKPRRCSSASICLSSVIEAEWPIGIHVGSDTLADRLEGYG
jgi:hypothetical protein